GAGAEAGAEAGHETSTPSCTALLHLAVSLSSGQGPAGAASLGKNAPVLVLIAERAIPTIAAFEGRVAAARALQDVVERGLGNSRPFALGALSVMAELNLVWCCGTNKARASGEKPCPVEGVLDDNPILAVEMIRAWPAMGVLVRNLLGNPLPGGGGRGTGSPQREGGWAALLSKLHKFGLALLGDLARYALSENPTKTVMCGMGRDSWGSGNGGHGSSAETMV
ncbi:unnamed protein product, partial [Discosporangium mesarthrocarpum]